MSGPLTSFVGRAHKRARRFSGHVRFRLSVRRSDVFIITYPKSGTNAVGFFLASVLADRAPEPAGKLDLISYRHWVPDANQAYMKGKALPEPRTSPEPRVYTLHATVSRVFPRVLYLVRDPRSVMVSYYHHFRAHHDDFDLSLDEFVRRNDAWPGDWGEHVRGWLQRADHDEMVRVLRYEELRCEPLEFYRKVVDLCGLPLTDAELERYCQVASFESMTNVEPDRQKREIPFVRQGLVDEWKDELSSRSIGTVELRYGALMSRLGYELAEPAAVANRG